MHLRLAPRQFDRVYWRAQKDRTTMNDVIRNALDRVLDVTDDPPWK